MRARLRYLIVSPRTPQYLSHRATEMLAVVLAALGVFLVVTGYASAAVFTALVEAGHLLGVAA